MRTQPQLRSESENCALKASKHCPEDVRVITLSTYLKIALKFKPKLIKLPKKMIRRKTLPFSLAQIRTNIFIASSHRKGVNSRRGWNLQNFFKNKIINKITKTYSEIADMVRENRTRQHFLDVPPPEGGAGLSDGGHQRLWSLIHHGNRRTSLSALTVRVTANSGEKPANRSLTSLRSI